MTPSRTRAWTTRGALACVILAGVLVLLSRQGSPTGRPGQLVMLITLDTTRADYLSPYGDRTTVSPVFDVLASDGVRFDRAYSTSNLTNPSHTSILTSMYVKDHGVADNHTSMPRTTLGLAELFRDAGFRTAAFVSVNHLGPLFGFDQGFDEFHAVAGDQHKAVVPADTRTDELLEWLRVHKSDSSFVWVHYFDPHTPYVPPAPFDTMYEDTSAESLSDPRIRAAIKRHSPWLLRQLTASDDPQHYRNQYRGELSFLDREIGRLLREIRDLGLYDGATIVVTADHGESLGEHDVYFEHNHTLHDPVVRVPLLVKTRGGRYSGSRSHLVSTVDIYPTLAELIGIPAPTGIRGVSLLPVLERPDASPVREIAYTEGGGRRALALRTVDDTFIWKFGGAWPDVSDQQSFLLYAHDVDPLQERDLSASGEVDVEALLELAEAYQEDVIPLGDNAKIVDSHTLEELRSLGYVPQP